MDQKYNQNKNIHELIDLIYAAAMEPEQWPTLLNGVAELLYNEPMDAAKPSTALLTTSVLGDTPQNDAPALSNALKQLSGNLQEPITTFTDDAETLNVSLSRHFVRALNVAKRLSELEQHNQAICSLLDQLPIALVLVNANAEVIEYNNQASALLNNKTPLFIRDGKLCTDRGIQNKQLLHAIGNLASQRTDREQQSTLIIPGNNHHDDLVIALSPLWQLQQTVSSVVALFISPRESQNIKLPESIITLYGLTEKEAKVTEALVQGKSLADIATQYEVSEHTVRTQVKSIFNKTNTHRQTELISLMLTGPGSFMKIATPDISSSLSIKSANQGTQYFTLGDGRTLAYNEYGDPNGIPLFYFHSALGSRLETAIDSDRHCKQRGIRLIQPDRPGFGESSPKEDHHFNNWGDDIAQLADHLGLERFSISGYAMGGIFAVACAAALPERVQHMTLISCGDTLKTKADFEHTTPLYRMTLKLARDLPGVHLKMSSLARRSVFKNITPFFNMLTSRIGKSDGSTVEQAAFKQIFHSALLECGRQGAEAHSRELNILMKPWELDIAAANVPCDIWHGLEDIHIPLSTSRRLAKKLPYATEHHLENEGHYLFFKRWSDILDTIIEKQNNN